MRFVVLPIVTLLLFACEDKPYADMTQKAHFERHGVAFDYPGNWALTETAAGVKDGSALHVMTVRTPSGAFVTIQSFEERMKLKVGAWADRLTKDYVRRFRERTQSFEAGGREGVERTFMGEIREGLKQSFTITDDERSSTLAAELFVAEFPGGTATLLIQGAGEDFARGKEGFELVLNTLKWTRPAPDREIPTIDIIAPPGADGKPNMEAAQIVVDGKPVAPATAPKGEVKPQGEAAAGGATPAADPPPSAAGQAPDG